MKHKKMSFKTRNRLDRFAEERRAQREHEASHKAKRLAKRMRRDTLTRKGRKFEAALREWRTIQQQVTPKEQKMMVKGESLIVRIMRKIVAMMRRTK